MLISELAYLVGPLAVAYGIDTAVPELAAGNAGPLVYATLVYLAAGMVNAAGKAIFVRLSAKVAQAVLLDLRGRVFTHSQALSLSFHERYTSGRVISRMTSDLDALADLAAESLEGLISGLLSVVAISITLLVLDVQLGLIALAAFIPILLATRWFQHRSRRIYRRTRSAIASVIVQFTETMNGLRAVLSFRREDKNRAIFGAFNDENAQANGDGLIALAVYTPLVRLFGNLSLVATMVIGAMQVIDGAMEIGVLAAFLLYVRRMYDPLDELAMFYNTYQGAAAALEKLSGLLEEVPAVPEPADPIPLAGGGIPAGDVLFEDVSFSYHPAVPVSAGTESDDSGRPDRCAGRCHWCREVDTGQAVGQVLRPDGRPGVVGRDRCVCGGHGGVAARHRDGHPGVVPVLRLGGRQHRARQAIGDPRGDRPRGRRHRGGRLHPRPAGGLRHRCPQAGRAVVGRSAAVGGFRAGVPGRSCRADPG